MIFIDETLPHIQKAKLEHLRYVKCRINKKLFDQSCSDPKCEICKSTNVARAPKPALEKLKTFLRHDIFLDSVIGGKPDELIRISIFLWDRLVPNFSWIDYGNFSKISRIKASARSPVQQTLFDKYNNAINAFSAVFDYYGWFGGDGKLRYDIYQMAFSMDRNTCTYCNRIYTHTAKGKGNSKIMRPQFDHWFSRSKHPALSLSFYNLIPSCSICNSSIKGALEFDLSTHLHPYLDINCQDNFEYKYKYNRSTKRYHISIESLDPSNPKIQRTYEDMKLTDVYNTHHSELADLIEIKKAYTGKYISKMISSWPKAHLSEELVYRLAFGVEYDGKKFYKRPLSKFKKDILRELKLIK